MLPVLKVATHYHPHPIHVLVESPCPVFSRMLKIGSSGAALSRSSRIWSTVGGSGRLGSTIRFLLLEPIFILLQFELQLLACNTNLTPGNRVYLMRSKSASRVQQQFYHQTITVCLEAPFRKKVEDLSQNKKRFKYISKLLRSSSPSRLKASHSRII